MTASLGQSLFDPPNVAGWAGGRTWITPSTLLQRGNLFRGVLFPDVKGFRPPDRVDVGDRRARRAAAGAGHEHHRGHKEDATRAMAESNMMVDRDEDYNTRYGGYKGNLLAFERTKLIPAASGGDRPDGDGRRPRAPTPSTRSSITSSTGSCRVHARRTRTARSLVEFLRGKLGSSQRPAGREAGGVAPRAALSRVEHAGVSVGIGREEARRWRRLRSSMSRTRCIGCSCSRRDFLARGLYGIGVGAGLPLVLSRTSAALAAQALAGHQRRKASRADSRRHRAVGRQRRLEHRRAVSAIPRTIAPGRSSGSPSAR